MFKDVTRSGMTGFTFLGNRELCINYVSLARHLLIGNLQTNTLPQFRRRIDLPDGAQIELLSNRGVNRIIIDVRRLVPELLERLIIEPRILTFATGLMSIYSRPQQIAEAHFAYPLEAWQVGEIVPISEGGAPRTYDVGYDDWVQSNITNPAFFFFSNANDKVVKYIHDRIPAAPDSGSLNTFAPQEYSGSMVKYQQMRISQGYGNVFSPNWSTTHGLWKWTGTIDDETVTRWWVIGINRSWGVRAWRIEFLDPRTINAANDAEAEANPDAEYFPLPTIEDGYEFYQEADKVFDFNDTETIQVASGESIKDAYEGSPLYLEAQGWKFSPDGGKACVVTRHYRDFSGTQIYWMQRWELTINGGSDGPTSASLSLEDEDWMYQNTTEQNNRAPISRLLGVNAIQEFSTFPTGGVKPSSGDPPFYSWYRPDTGARVDIDFHFETLAAGIDIFDTRTLATGPQARAPCQAPVTALTIPGSLGLYRRFSHGGLSNNYFTCSLGDLGFGEGVEVSGANLRMIDVYGTTDSGSPFESTLANCPGDGTYFITTQNKFLLNTEELITSYTTRHAFSLMIPTNHAQCVVLYAGKHEIFNAHDKDFNQRSACNETTEPYKKPPGSGTIGTHSRGRDVVTEGTGSVVSTEPIPDTDSYEEIYQAILNGEIIDLPGPGTTSENNVFTSASQFLNCYATSEAFEPERYIISTHGIAQINESGYEPPNEGGVQLLSLFFGNHEDPKPWEPD